MTNATHMLIWNHSEGPRGVGEGPTLHPGLNVLEGARWRSGCASDIKDVDELGHDLQAIDARTMVRAIRGTVNPGTGPSVYRSALAQSLAWLDEHETRPRVKRAIRRMREADFVSRTRGSAAQAIATVREFLKEEEMCADTFLKVLEVLDMLAYYEQSTRFRHDVEAALDKLAADLVPM